MKTFNHKSMRLLIFIALLFSSRMSIACDNLLNLVEFLDTRKDTVSNTAGEDSILPYAEKMPVFPGGIDSLINLIISRMNTPEQAIKDGNGGKLFLQFVINKYGKLINPKILKGVGGGWDEEVLRAIKDLPDWKPGEQGGKVVNVYYTLPILIANKPFTRLDRKPEYPEGFLALIKYISDNLVYPKEAKKRNICGTVMVQFVVNTEGKVKNAKVIESVDSLLDKEALRVINSLPRWTPGICDGKRVPVYKSLPVVFSQKGCVIPNNTISVLNVTNDYGLQNHPPKFPGGPDSLYAFLRHNMKYPKDAENKGITGTVYIRMNVDENGTIINPVIAKGLHYSLDDEALRLVSLFPKFDPAIKNGKPVYWQDFTLNFDFFIHEDWSKRDSLTKFKDGEPLMFVEQMPEYPGGQDAMMRFLAEHIQYPKLATDLGVTGRVIVQFVVRTDGSITNIKVLRPIGAGCDEEAIRVLSLMPPWKPGRQNGNLVPVYFTLPIVFQLKE